MCEKSVTGGVYIVSTSVESLGTGKNVSFNLMAICTLCGKTDAELAEMCGTSESEVHAWRLGYASVPLDAAYKISDILHLNVHDLFRRV